MNATDRADVVARFWVKVNKTDSCWLWTGCRMKYGYGQMKIGGRRGSVVTTHRLSWLLHRGEIPDGMHVLHRCDNPPCVRPDHLFLGTQADNNRDMWAKGRNKNVKYGESHSRSKLNAVQVRILRRVPRRGTYAFLARVWGVDGTTTRNAAVGRTWRMFS